MKLIIPSVTYYSQADEDSFFGWLHSIPDVTEVVGEHKDLIVSLASNTLSDSSLRDLIALHQRYLLPMQSLAQFETPSNSSWFRSPVAFWHSAVFC